MEPTNGKRDGRNGDSLVSPKGWGPPAFEQARNRRQKVRAAGLDPDYWYPVEHDANINKGQIVEVVFWGTSIAVFRGEDGQLHAIANRCAHRQLKLSLGHVEDCAVVCPYHGWTHDGEGKVVNIPHELFGREMPKFKVPSYPVRVRYGLVWIFPGNPALATKRHIPDIPELEGEDRWACVPVDFTWNAHHSMIIDNVSDFTHAYLHRKYRPFSDAKLVRLDADDDRVLLAYETKVGGGRISGLFVDRKKVNTNHMELGYEYPYQWSNTDDKIKHWCFVLPIDERTTRAFFLFYFKSLKVPIVPITIPRWLMTPLLRVANKVMVSPLLSEDGFAVEAEQLGYERHFEAPIAELNPAVHEFQKLTVSKWEAHLERRSQHKPAAAATKARRRKTTAARPRRKTSSPAGA